MTEKGQAGAVDGVTGNAVHVTLWGPSSAGKTVFLAQLYNEAPPDGDWEVFPTAGSLAFVREMRQRMSVENVFPAANTGVVEQIRYRLRHRRTRREVVLEMEDRTGTDYEQMVEETRARLAEAAGLVLLFDPRRSAAQLEKEVWQTLEELGATAGTQDERPIAVCLSKADLLVHSPAELERALAEPEAFVRERIGPKALRALRRFCERFRLFPISATGSRIVHGTVERAVFYDERRRPRVCPEGSAPFNLMAPFAWVLQEALPAGPGDGP